MATFAELGIPFPLFEAPIETCSGYAGAQDCCVSQQKKEHCFELSIGSWIKVGCPACGGDLFLSALADTFRPKTCRHCGGPTPPPFAGETAFVSYEALRAGLAGFTKFSDYGMISWEQMEIGWTHGVPGGRFPGLETRMKDEDGANDEGWVEVRLPNEVLSELTRTPEFITWQGARWLFQGARPMIYVGEWKKRDFKAHTSEGWETEEFFKDVMRDAEPGFWSNANDANIYVFRDGGSGLYAAYYDMD